MKNNMAHEWIVAYVLTTIAIGAQWYAIGKQEIVNLLNKSYVSKEK